MQKSDRDPALQRAIEICGGPAAVARLFEIEPQAVSQWRLCPVARAVGLEEATHFQVTKEELRPDIFKPRCTA